MHDLGFGAGGGAVQMQRHAEVDKFLCSQHREAEGDSEMEELSRVSGEYTLQDCNTLGESKY